MKLGQLFWMLSLLSTASAYAERILVIGDSHTAGTFGHTLDRELRKYDSTSVQTYGSCGSIISWWYTGHATTCGYWSSDIAGNSTTELKHETPKVLSLIANAKPELIVIALGSNYARGYGSAQTQSEIRKLLSDVKATGARCAWIGPPDMRRFRAELPSLVSLIQKEVSSTCLYLDSRNYTTYSETGGDGIHYETPELRKISQKWAEAVTARIQAAGLLSTRP